MRQNLLALGSVKNYRFLEDTLNRKDLRKVEGAFSPQLSLKCARSEKSTARSSPSKYQKPFRENGSAYDAPVKQQGKIDRISRHCPEIFNPALRYADHILSGPVVKSP
jgi:hypothetical protein